MTFYNCHELEIVNFPTNCATKVFGDQAFYWCDSLRKITIPDAVVEIHDEVFKGCMALEELNISNDIEYIGKEALFAKKINFDFYQTDLRANKFLESVIMEDDTVVSFKGFTHEPINTSVEESIEEEKVEAPIEEVKPKKKKGCYIATCVYGNYDGNELWTLRRYRDEVLANHWYGRAFIKVYYAISPMLVKLFGGNRLFKKVFRSILDKKVKRLNKKGISNNYYVDR